MTGSGRIRWVPPILLGLGVLLTLGASVQRVLPLRRPLGAVVPTQFVGFAGKDYPISEEEQKVAGMSDYLFRVYSPPATAATAYSIYVGYYETQRQGKTIHSPKNCMPGAGWEALTASTLPVRTAQGTYTVNQYLLQNGKQIALVLYWYQGRGHVEADEYRVKWNLLRDSALRARSDEALVRIIVPVRDSREAALDLAARVAAQLIPAVGKALPA